MPDKKLPYNAEDGRELFDNLFAVASTTECTGLIPAAPEEAPEITSYSDIYDIPLANDPSAAKHDIQNVKKTDKTNEFNQT